MASTFGERIDALKESVGRGKLTGRVVYDQVYAVNQHEAGWVNFMGRFGPKAITEYHGGGGAKYLANPLYEGADASFQRIAEVALEPDGPKAGMVEAVEKLADDSAAAAPVEFGDLRESAHPTVIDDGTTVYDRPPMVPRLTAAQLREKSRKAASGSWARDYLEPSHPLHGTTHKLHGGAHDYDPAHKPRPTVDAMR